jgi:diamine N-acetyltransferase
MDISLRLATEQDYELMLAWRNDREISLGFYSQGGEKIISWEEHLNWIKSRNKDWRTFIIIYKNRRIGVFTIGQLDHWCPEIGYYIGEKSLWGKGIIKEAIKLGLEYIKNYGKEYAHSSVKDNNPRSIRVLKSLGFEQTGSAREGETWYQKKL